MSAASVAASGRHPAVVSCLQRCRADQNGAYGRWPPLPAAVGGWNAVGVERSGDLSESSAASILQPYVLHDAPGQCRRPARYSAFAGLARRLEILAHEGGGLYFGDCKALMGDGEIVAPPEVGALVTASAEPRQRPASLEWPRIETAERLMTLVSGTPLEWSARQAFRELLNWVVEDYELPRPKAALLLAMVADARIAQISNTQYTAYCSMPRRVLRPYARD
jgi:hypothetical protein